MADGSRVPRIIAEASALRSLRIGAADGFVLSRIDGRASEKELASLTGLPDSQIRASLDNLASLNAIAFGPAPRPSQVNLAAVANPAQLGTGVAADGAPKLPGEPVSNALLEKAIADIPADAAELAEEVDLPVDLRRRILGLHSVATSLDHYAILGLARNVDKKGVKRSYFELAALFHPDRYFRKNIGSFKAKMEVIFAKVSVAYETLADKEQRAEYDLYLGDVEKSRNIEAMLRNVMDEVATAENAVMELAGSAVSLSPAALSSAPPTSDGQTSASGPPSSVGAYSMPRPGSTPAPTPPPAATPPPPPRTPVADQLRREALAKRLSGNRPVTRPPSAPVTPPPVISAAKMNSADAVDALKRRHQERVEAGRRQQGQKYVSLGETAESRNDLTAAAAAYRVALTFLREEDAAYAHARDVIAKSEAALADTYVRQADHEERANRWEDATRSWGRAVKLRPNDARALERHAHALVKTSGDLHEAAQLAQKAVALAPTLGDYRCTLATVYMAAGLNLNARRELEAAATQFPDNPNIPLLMKKLNAGKPA